MKPLHPTFERLMREATRLTRGNQLQQATAAIRAALARQRGAAVTSPSPAATADATVIDIEARTVGVGHAPPAGPTRAGPQAAGRFISGSFTGAAGTRDYKLFIPPGAEGAGLPLVVMLHGCKQDPDDFAAGTGMNAAALAQGFMVLYPAQAHNANPSRCWNWFKHTHQQRGRGEPALLAGMTRQVLQQHGADPDRIYVAGLSAGGAMAAILGHTDPDLFAAVGVHSGLASGSASDLQSALAAMQNGGKASAAPDRASRRAPPTIVFHGDKDATVHPLNGEQALAASVRAETAESESGSTSAGRTYTRRIFRDTRGKIVAEHWAVHGGGHAWSGGQPGGSYTDSNGPDATAAMLRFFLAQRLRATPG